MVYVVYICGEKILDFIKRKITRTLSDREKEKSYLRFSQRGSTGDPDSPNTEVLIERWGGAKGIGWFWCWMRGDRDATADNGNNTRAHTRTHTSRLSLEETCHIIKKINSVITSLEIRALWEGRISHTHTLVRARSRCVYTFVI